MAAGETAIFAAIAAQVGVPTILITGDEAVAREARAAIPGVHTVAVKKGLNRYASCRQMRTLKHYGTGFCLW